MSSAECDTIDQTQREMHAAFLMLDRVVRLMQHESVRVAMLNYAYIALHDVEEAQAGLARAMGRRRHARQIVTSDESKPNAR